MLNLNSIQRQYVGLYLIQQYKPDIHRHLHHQVTYTSTPYCIGDHVGIHVLPADCLRLCTNFQFTYFYYSFIPSQISALSW